VSVLPDRCDKLLTTNLSTAQGGILFRVKTSGGGEDLMVSAEPEPMI
jgi:hypothetical protein